MATGGAAAVSHDRRVLRQTGEDGGRVVVPGGCVCDPQQTMSDGARRQSPQMGEAREGEGGQRDKYVKADGADASSDAAVKRS